jgi:exodeoxyribonuclease III
MLKILSWNIRQGGGSRQMAISEALANCKCDIIQLSEFKNNKTGDAIKTALKQAGYNFLFSTEAKDDENSVLIASKYDGQKTLHPEADPNFPNNILEIKFPAFTLIGVYLPHKKKHTLFTKLCQLALQKSPLIIVGDYNTGKNFKDQKGDSFWYQHELRTLEATGMVDAFRFIYPEKEEYSWFSHQKNGYRYDHTYVSQDLCPIIKTVFYLHDWREKGLSDHSPMLLEIG